MASKVTPASPGIKPWKNDSARQRWELFHRAIAHAKESNVSDLDDEQGSDSSSVADASKAGGRSRPVLRLAK